MLQMKALNYTHAVDYIVRCILKLLIYSLIIVKRGKKSEKKLRKKLRAEPLLEPIFTHMQISSPVFLMLDQIIPPSVLCVLVFFG